MGVIIGIIVLGIGIGLAAFFIVRNQLAPKKIARLEQLLKQGKGPAAIRVAKQMLARNQRDAQVHYLLGNAYQLDNKPELALMEYRTVNELGVFDAVVPEIEFRRKIAELFMRFNQPEEALKEYLLLVQKEPNEAENYYRIGLLFESRNKAGKALGYFRKAIELKPGHGHAHLRLGTILYRAKRFPDAKQHLEKALRFQPEAYEAHYFLGRILKDSRDYAAALEAFERAAKATDYRQKAHIERGTCYMEMNNLERAISELERAITLHNDQTVGDTLWAHYFAATCYERTRRIERAIDHWEAIYAREPGFQDVAEKLANYAELREDDNVKDFMTESQENYRELCRKATAVMGLAVQSIDDVPDGVSIVAVESSSDWRATRKQPRLVWFLRVAEVIEERTVRELHEAMRQQNLARAMLVVSSTYSRSALDFAESRPIELYNREKLQEILKRVK